MQKILFTDKMGDKCPSQLLFRMMQLLKDNVRTSTVVQIVFAVANVQDVLATASTMDLTGLADKVTEVATPSVTAAKLSPADSCTSAAKFSIAHC